MPAIPMTRDQREFVRVNALMQQPNAIFVFGSNLAGRHGAGAAKTAVEQYGAILGQGEGLQGKAYALPTKDRAVLTLNIEQIEGYIGNFVYFAKANPKLLFVVTRVGCGLAGYLDSDIAPLFAKWDPPKNCKLPGGW